jgi:hypothetical protein
MDEADRADQDKIIDGLETLLRAYKSPVALYNVANVVLNNTDVSKKRSLNALVPASGNHVAPLLVAMAMIDDQKIDRAHFVYTEIKSDTVENVMSALDMWSSIKPQLSKPEIIDSRKGDHDGTITTLRVFWHGRPITIDVKINDSPEGRYFTSEDAYDADVIIFHDLGNYGQVPTYDTRSFPDALEVAIADSVNGEHSVAPKRRILVINEFGTKYHYTSPFFAKALSGNYGCAYQFDISSPVAKAKARWGELGAVDKPGTWMSLSLKDQPLLAALESKEEVEHLVDLGIAANDIIRDNLSKTPVKFRIREGDIGKKELETLWKFGLDLHNRLNPTTNAAKCLRYLMIRVLATALGEVGSIKRWAKNKIRSFNKDGIPSGFKNTLNKFDLMRGRDRVSSPGRWIEDSRWIKSKVDGYLVLKKK